jgi:hypothetical protein
LRLLPYDIEALFKLFFLFRPVELFKAIWASKMGEQDGGTLFHLAK